MIGPIKTLPDPLIAVFFLVFGYVAVFAAEMVPEFVFDGGCEVVGELRAEAEL